MAESIADILKKPEFNLASLTQAINLLPYKPSRIGAMRLFGEEGINSTVAKVEEYQGKLSLIQTRPRGAPATASEHEKRKIRSFDVPHIPKDDVVQPDDVQGVRKFGSSVMLDGVVEVVNRRMTKMRQDHELTLEFHRLGALKGKILDADGTELYNLFTHFGVAEQTVAFALGTTTTKVRKLILEAVRKIETALGAVPYDHIHALCGAGFFDKLISHTDVEKAFDRWQDGALLRDDPRSGFPFAKVIWEEYRGAVGEQPFIGDQECHLFPVGVPGMFMTYFAPANMMGAVNTVGLPVYARQEPMPMDSGIRLHTQSNPLCLNTRPNATVRGTTN